VTFQADRIDFSSGFLERFAREFAALPKTGAPWKKRIPGRKP
jgi:hypothetical protein